MATITVKDISVVIGNFVSSGIGKVKSAVMLKLYC